MNTTKKRPISGCGCCLCLECPSSGCLYRLFQVLSPAARQLVSSVDVTDFSLRPAVYSEVRSEHSALPGSAFVSLQSPSLHQQTQHLLTTVTCFMRPLVCGLNSGGRGFFFALVTVITPVPRTVSGTKQEPDGYLLNIQSQFGQQNRPRRQLAYCYVLSLSLVGRPLPAKG